MLRAHADNSDWEGVAVARLPTTSDPLVSAAPSTSIYAETSSCMPEPSSHHIDAQGVAAAGATLPTEFIKRLSASIFHSSEDRVT